VDEGRRAGGGDRARPRPRRAMVGGRAAPVRGQLLLAQARIARGHRGGGQPARGPDRARCRRAKWLELRAALNLSRLWQGRGRRERRATCSPASMVASPGFDTADLRGRALLHERPDGAAALLGAPGGQERHRGPALRHAAGRLRRVRASTGRLPAGREPARRGSPGGRSTPSSGSSAARTGRGRVCLRQRALRRTLDERGSSPDFAGSAIRTVAPDDGGTSRRTG
jgi:hypothetical protein